MQAGLSERGFTLLEIVIALAVCAIALVALTGSLSQSIRTSDDLRKAQVARWVADNALTRTQLEGELRPGRRSGIEQMLGQEWQWELTISETQVDGILRLDVAVRRGAESDTRARASGFAAR